MVRVFASILIGLVITAGTIYAAYFDFKTGMIIFWIGCMLLMGLEGLRILRMRSGVKGRKRVYLGSALSILLNVIFGYGGAYLIYTYGGRMIESNQLLSLWIPERAPLVLALTGVIYATLQIFIAVGRALMALVVPKKS
ncbi:hypothetical protein DRN67_01745 [Candidatus Micrarchaeota archaeon]|nr:MAG: hypothetical protein DRN67_01745 [Candidatus Micrarchaeota archaeon]